jgi:hypothetical protein
MKKIADSHLLKGLIIAIITFIYILITENIGGYVGAKDNSQYIPFIWMPLIAASVFLQAKLINNQQLFGNLFAHGFKVCAAAVTILVCFILIDEFFIHTSLKAEAIAFVKQTADADKEMDANQKNEAVAKFGERYLVAKIGVLLIFYIIFGALGALVGALVSPRKPAM